MKHRKLWGKGLFAAYILWMLWLLFGQRIGSGNYVTQENKLNLELFYTIRWFVYVLKEVADPAIRRHAVVNLVGNVVMFVPLGFFMPLLWKKLRKLLPFILAALTVIVSIELIQLMTALGCCDVDDLLLNLPGMLLGYLAWRVFFPVDKTGNKP